MVEVNWQTASWQVARDKVQVAQIIIHVTVNYCVSESLFFLLQLVETSGSESGRESEDERDVLNFTQSHHDVEGNRDWTNDHTWNDGRVRALTSLNFVPILAILVHILLAVLVNYTGIILIVCD